MADDCHFLKIEKIAISQHQFDRLSQNFTQIHPFTLNPIGRYKFKFLKIEDGGRPPYLK